MNKVILSGRLTKDPTGNDGSYARFTLAVDRRFKKEGEPEADFISCVAFGVTASFVLKFFRQGVKMNLCGRVQTGSYEKDGRKIYTTDVVAEEVEFGESKKESAPPPTPEFMEIPDIKENELPFK